MDIKKRIEQQAQKIIDKIDKNSVSQRELSANGKKEVFDGIDSLICKASAESIVLLKNNGELPLDKSRNISVFGRCQIDYFYVGYGSGGDVNPPYTVNFIQGVKNQGYKINEKLLSVYENWCNENPVFHGIWGHWPMCYDEMEISDETIKKNCDDFSTALVIIGRAAGEDRENKLEEGSYYLTKREKDMISSVTNNFENVVLVMNCANIIDMSWTEDYGNKISAIIYAWQGGMESGNALAKVLWGDISPCGKLPDTIAKRYEDYPSSKNFGGREYNIYEEDIFVGYRYFETFAKEKVLFPFGFGLSYTEFEITRKEFTVYGDRVSVKAEVKNIGTRSGKEVLQLYCRVPQGALSKADVVLTAFKKTSLLAPNESQTIELSADLYNVSSFDDLGKTGNKYCYVLEKGQYEFLLGNSVRNIKTVGCFEIDELRVLEKLSEICGEKTTFSRMTAKKTANGYETDIEAVRASKPYLKQRILSNLPKAVGYKGDKGLKLRQVANGKATMDDFISQLTDEELEGLTRGEGKMDSELGVSGNAGAFGGILPPLRDKGIPPIITTDGPAGIRIREYTSLVPCGAALASTFDCDLVQSLTSKMGEEMKKHKTDILLAPGMNIHRNVLCGRNFEYFSEDPILTGKIAAAYVKGVQSQGVSACPKHFACNNQETMRTVNDSIVSQRALREIYLKGFEICVKESKPLNIMTSYNKINGVWSHYNYDLATTLLRGEWGYDGNVMTDWWMQRATSPEFDEISDNAYRVRSQVDVLMPGGIKHTERKYKVDGSLLKTIGKKDGITRGELERTAKNVLNLIIKLKF